VLFLIEYDRDSGKLVSLKEFEDSERTQAEDLRLELEVNLNRRGIIHEVVLLQATDKKALQQTHRRYFVGLGDLARATSA
jgi:hypothetical protein